MNRRHVALAIVGLVLTTTVAYAATTLTAETRGTVPVGASGGPMAGVTADRTDLTDYSINQSAAQINTSAGSLVIDGQDDAYARIDRFEGTWTNISEVDTNGGEIRIAPGDKQMAVVDGGIESLSWRSKSATEADDGTVDFNYSAGSEGNITLGGLEPNRKVAAIDDDSATEAVLDNSTTDASGTVTFELAGQHDVRIRNRPNTLTIRNESSPSQLVTGTQSNPTVVDLTFYFGEGDDSDQIITRSTSDGTLNMSGLPANEDFVVVAKADGYHSRRIYVESLYQQADIYLLPTSAPSVVKLFTLADFTGKYPQDVSVLKVQRGIQGSWETIQGDYFGAAGEFEAILREDVRHRLVILNTNTGERRPLGRITPLNSGAKEIEIQSEDDISLSRTGPIPSVLPTTRALPAGQTDVTVGVDPVRSNLTRWNYTVEAVWPNGTVTRLANDTLQQAGTKSPGLNLTNKSDATIRVSVGWETADGRSMVTTEKFRAVPGYGGFSILDGLTQFPTLFSNPADGAAATSVIALFVAVFGAGTVALKLQPSSEGIGFVAVGILAVFSLIGWIAPAVIFATGVGWTVMVALRRGL